MQYICIIELIITAGGASFGSPAFKHTKHIFAESDCNWTLLEKANRLEMLLPVLMTSDKYSMQVYGAMETLRWFDFWHFFRPHISDNIFCCIFFLRLFLSAYFCSLVLYFWERYQTPEAAEYVVVVLQMLQQAYYYRI